MPVVFVVLGSILVLAGLFFAFKGIAVDKAGADGLKSFSVTGPSWLILVAIGAGVIVGGTYLWKGENATPQEISPTTTAEPFDYGDDPVLDALYDSCEAGSMGDCDDLYANSPAGSNYEVFGSWCGYATEEQKYGGCNLPPDGTAVVGEPSVIGPTTTG